MPRERTSIASPRSLGSRVFVRRPCEPLSETVLGAIRDVSAQSIRLTIGRLFQVGDGVVIQSDEFKNGYRPRISAVVTQVQPDDDRGYELICTFLGERSMDLLWQFY